MYLAQRLGRRSTTAACATALPSKPSGLTVVSRTSNSLGISWNASAGGVSYGVYLGNRRLASTTATTYTFTGLACATSYRMGVDAARSSEQALRQGVGFGCHTCLFSAAAAPSSPAAPSSAPAAPAAAAAPSSPAAPSSAPAAAASAAASASAAAAPAVSG